MTLLKRISDSFWSYVSPTKTPTTETGAKRRKLNQAPATAPPRFSKLVNRNEGRKGSIQDIVRNSRSMSPSERVDSWRVGSSSRATSSVAERSRKRKAMEMEYEDESMEVDSEEIVDDDDDVIEDEEMVDEDMVEYDEYGKDIEYDEDVYDEEEDELHDDNMHDINEDVSKLRLRASKSPGSSSSHKGFIYSDEESSNLGHDDSVFVSEAEYFASPSRRKLIQLPEEHLNRGVSTEHLRAEGWDDDHIVLVQKIATRGFEPLLPRIYKDDFRYMPDNLFEVDDKEREAFITSVRGQQYRGIKALKKLFEFGGRVRDRILTNELPDSSSRKGPEMDAIKHVREYMKWAAMDADQLDPATVIPLVALECKPADTDAGVLQENIRKKMAKLHARWRGALRAQPSIENSPSSESTKLHYPVPQIYGVVASHTIVVVVAYRADAEPVLKTEDGEVKAGQDGPVRNVAFFDMKDKDYDVWNALALAVVICHARDVQIRIGEETGVGMKGPDWVAPPVDDPDL